MDEELTSANPFDDPSLAQRYEHWYADKGRRADRLEKALLEWLIGHFQEPRSILEVGCGTGHFTRWFESLGLRAVGLDISSAMQAEARRYGTPAAVRADASRPLFADGAFDLVAMIITLEFLGDPVRTLQGAGRVASKELILGVINRKGIPTPGWSPLAIRPLLQARRTSSNAKVDRGFCVQALLASNAVERLPSGIASAMGRFHWDPSEP